jgi:hypothetical protein
MPHFSFFATWKRKRENIIIPMARIGFFSKEFHNI